MERTRYRHVMFALSPRRLGKFARRSIVAATRHGGHVRLGLDSCASHPTSWQLGHSAQPAPG